jgi:hypothetical protein
MAEARVPKIDTGGESEVVGGGGCRLDGIQCIAGAITSTFSFKMDASQEVEFVAQTSSLMEKRRRQFSNLI